MLRIPRASVILALILATSIPVPGEYAPNVDEVATVNTAYDFDKVCRVVYHEAGNNEDLQRAVATCIVNACDKTLLNPEEVCREYRYTTPWDSCPEICEAVCEDVLILGNRMADVADATLFYAPKYCAGTWHETQVFVCEIGGVRFFEEVN